jgi:protein O-GlcNAc transferase
MNRRQRRAAAKRSAHARPYSVSDSSQSSTANLFNVALQYQRDGRLTDAERLCLQILDINPNHAFGLHLLGLLAHQLGHRAQAIERIEQAIGINNRVPEFHHNLASILREMGRASEAVTCYQRALKLAPNSVETRNYLAMTLQDLGRVEEAVSH